MAAALSWLGVPVKQAKKLAGHWAAKQGKGCGGPRMVDTVMLLARRGVRVEKKSAELLIEADLGGLLESITPPLYMRLLKMAEILPEQTEEEIIVALTK